MSEPQTFDPDLYPVLLDKVKAAGHVTKLKTARDSSRERQVPEYDSLSTAPGLEAIVTDRVKQFYDDASAESGDYSLYSFQPGENLEDGEKGWLLKIPTGAFHIDQGSVRFTLRASFKDGEIINSEAWAFMSPGSVIEIKGSNGTFWRNDEQAI